MEFYHSQSTERPEETDVTSSKAYNYVRRNIVEKETEQEEGTLTVYEYEEAKVAKEDWGLYLDTAQNTADIEYIAAMSDIEL